MIFPGTWSTCEDGVVRPVMRATVLSHDRRWLEVEFLVDPGADRTVLIWPVALQLGLNRSGAGTN
jgi:hypothetical protein